MRIKGTWRITRHGGLVDDYVGTLVIGDGVLMVQGFDEAGALRSLVGWPLGDIAKFESASEPR